VASTSFSSMVSVSSGNRHPAGSGEVSDDEVESAAFTVAEGSSSVSLALALPATHVATRHTPRDMNGRRGAPHLLELER
jgi:hypothetical protein